MSDSLELIRAEHRNIARVLRILEDTAKDDAALAKMAKSDLLTSILYYLRVFPYSVHHPKEERHLFPAIAEKDRAAAVAVAALHKEHAEGYALLQEIDALAATSNSEADLRRLKTAILDYVTHEWKHMSREEEDILPVAEKVLSKDTLESIRNAFASHADPLFGENIQTGFDALYQRIQNKTGTQRS